MSDEDLAKAECQAAKEEGRQISDACARVIASLYHGGQATAGYAFASSGAIPDHEMSDDGTEIWFTGPNQVWESLFNQPAGFFRTMPAEDRILGDMLHSYLEDAGPRGPVNGWSGLWLA